MAWIADNAATIVVLLVLIAVVGAIVRGMVRGGSSCAGCSGECAGCSGECPTAGVELSQEQIDRLDAVAPKKGEMRS